MLLLNILLLYTLFNPLSDTNITYMVQFGNFKGASSITSAREEFIFVADTEDDIIYKFDIKGNLISSFGGSGFSNDEFNKPVNVDASNDLNIYVTDYQNNRIQKYDINFNYITTINLNNYNLRPDQSDKIYYPRGSVSLSNQELIILAKSGNFGAIKTDESGNKMTMFGSDVGESRLQEPVKIIKGNKLDLFVFDKKLDAVFYYDNFGNLVKKIENKNDSLMTNIAYYDDKLYILYPKKVLVYDIPKGQYVNTISYNLKEKQKAVDLSVINDKKFFILTNNCVYKIEFN